MNFENLGPGRMKSSRRSGKQRATGVSLVDVLIGIFVFGIVFSAGLSGLKYSSQLGSAQDELALANSSLSQVTEDIWATDYSSLSTGTSLGAYYTSGAGKPDALSDLTNASFAVTVSEPEGAATGLKKVTVTLIWNATVGIPSPQTIVLYINEPS